MALNLSKLLYRGQQPSFLTAIEPIPEAESALKEAKETIRSHLQKAIPAWLTETLGEKPTHAPRFRTQGSWAYRTCNKPCQIPPQEMDWDLGIYLPVSLWDDNDVSPKQAAKTFYSMVKEVMAPLAKEQGWTLTEKPTCIRVILNQGTQAHVDLPLYAAPDKDFPNIKEVVAKSIFAREAFAYDQANQPLQWDSLTRISLACQDGTWNDSDPGLVVKWFKSKQERHGEQLRRICRYLKAWRDHVWKSGGPSSIVLMVCAAQTLDRAAEDFEGRDDLALCHVLNALPGQLLNPVTEPMINPAEDLNRLSEEDQKTAAQLADDFRRAMNQALLSGINEKIQAVLMLQEHLGQRLPANYDVISVDTTADIRTIPPVPGPRTLIPATKAGDSEH
ncbi:CBASS cGAMP synthase [Azonexus fungiphilus]|uniref:CBASS cGAMP synthase n=1 Tax=Azonexus fungiphilus TaxID=146940 RepID=UPI00156B8F71|nr:hypothetical protein [Azonexus fungiphilus]NHC06387.1 hypothetical protein [Azonexus fungiphilus]